MSFKSITGGCFCGHVRYEAAAKPLGSMICHCQTCRRVSGAPTVAWLSFAQSDFRFTAGDPHSFASSPGILRKFCSECGTQLTYENHASPSEVDVATSSLDEPAAFPPTHHSWLSHNIPWVVFGDGLPSYQRSRNDD